MIGEIRDFETAQIAIQASLTGHLVLATVHTNDAPSTVDAADRHGRRALPAQLVAARRAGAAPGAQAVPCMQPAGRDGRWHPVGCENCLQPATRAAPASTS
jgi:general secretion pathway protein E